MVKRRFPIEFEGKEKPAAFSRIYHGQGGFLHYVQYYYVKNTTAGCKLPDYHYPYVHWMELSEKDMLNVLSLSDIIILNLGIHYHKCTVLSFFLASNKATDLLIVETRKNPHKKVVLRSTLPTHHLATQNRKTKTGVFRPGLFDEMRKKTCWHGVPPVDDPTNGHQKTLAETFGFAFYDAFNVYKARGDLHSVKYLFDSKAKNRSVRDCTHFCYSPELIFPELALLNNALENV